MGFWNRLLRILAEPPPEKFGERKKRSRYKPGGMDQFFPGSMGQPSRQFRRSFGDRYADKDEED